MTASVPDPQADDGVVAHAAAPDLAAIVTVDREAGRILGVRSEPKRPADRPSRQPGMSRAAKARLSHPTGGEGIGPGPNSRPWQHLPDRTALSEQLRRRLT